MFVEPNWVSLTLSFPIFRLFDILKPWPVRQLERLPDGSGIMTDDQVAAIYAAIVLWITMRAL